MTIVALTGDGDSIAAVTAVEVDDTEEDDAAFISAEGAAEFAAAGWPLSQELEQPEVLWVEETEVPPPPVNVLRK